MSRKSVLPLIVVGLILTFVFAPLLQAQPLIKTKERLTLGLNKNKSFIPVDYSNYKKVGPFTKNLLIRINQLNSSLSNNFSAKKQKSHNPFLKAKRHSVSVPVNRTTKTTMNKPALNGFLKQKRN